MICDNCKSERLLGIKAKCDDRCSVDFNAYQNHDYVPRDIGLGGGDYIEFDVCLNCGKVQGEFPLEDPEFAVEVS